MDGIYVRHGSSHYINVKYGYILIAISIFYILIQGFIKYVYMKKWLETGNQNPMLKRLLTVPLWLQVIIWIVILLGLVFFHVENIFHDYSMILKRFGRLGYSLLPLTIYLSLRPANISQHQIGYYLESLNLHKWISRIIIVFGFIHGVGFMIKWTFQKKLGNIMELVNLYGLMVLILASTLLVFSIRFFRRRNYQLFYILHNCTLWLFTGVIAFHARPNVTVITLICFWLFCYQLYQRFIKSYLVSGLKIIEIENSSLKLIKINKPANFPNYIPASHIRINFRGQDIRSWMFATHPYTIASCHDDGDDTLDLIVKTTETFKLDDISEYSLTGPFPSLPIQVFNSAKIINIICGGSGISFGLPIYKYFLNLRTIPIQLIWCIRNKNDRKILQYYESNEIKIYLTSFNDPLSRFDNSDQQDGLLSNDNNEDDTFELSTLNPEAKSRNFHHGRPNLDEVLSNFSQFNDNRWLIACGPDALIQESKAFSAKNNLEFYSEAYEM